MSINGIGSYQLAANSLYSGQTQTASAVESDGDVDRSRTTAPIDTSGKSGLFATAISQTLFQIGVTPAAANVATGAAPTNTQQQALNSFTQNLFGALQASGDGKIATYTGGKTSAIKKDGRSSTVNSTSENQSSDDTVNADSASTTGITSNQQTGAALNSNLENRLQNLIQQVGTGSQSSADSTPSSQPLAELQQSYQGLLASQPASTARPSLSSFLQVLSQNLQDAPSSGTLINIQA